MKWSILLVVFNFAAIAKNTKTTLEISKLADNLYQHKSYEKVGVWGLVAASGLILVDDNQAYVFDTPWSNKDSEKIIVWAKAHNLQIKAVVVTHFHQDASGGLETFSRHNIPTFASNATNELLAHHNKPTATYHIGEIGELLSEAQIEVFYPGAGHSIDNQVIWLPEQKFLFAGCFVKSQQSRSLGNLADADTVKWLTSIRRVKKRYPDVKIIMPGHGPLGGINLLNHTETLLMKHLEKTN